MRISELTYIIGIEPEITRTKRKEGKGWYVTFRYPHSEVKDGSILSSLYGVGSTIREAKQDYASQIKGKILVFNAMTKDRKEYRIPPTLTGWAL